MKPTTLSFLLVDNKKILLGRKKRGFGSDKYNGFGGKIEDYETFRQCAVREILEESSLLVKPTELEVVALLDFVFPHKPELTHIGYVYLFHNYQGYPLESEEMEPQWFDLTNIPYHKMWQGDRQWIPLILEGKKIKGTVTFDDDNESIKFMNISEVDDILESEHIDEIKQWLNG